MRKIDLTVFAIVVLITGCIDYQEGAALWETGRVDNRLAGKWRSVTDSNASTLVFQAGSNCLVCIALLSPTNDVSSPLNIRVNARTVQINEMSFLIVHNVRDEVYRFAKATGAQDIPNTGPQPDWGSIVSYSYSNDKLAFYMPNQSMFRAAIKDGKLSGTLPETNMNVRSFDPVRLTCLDSNTLSSLESMFQSTNCWSHIVEYVRSK
jgi:hypothetical protein